MNEELSTASEGGAAPDTGQQTDADPQAQASGQGQSSEPGAVDPGESQASSKRGQARENFNWANQRLLEKTVQKVLSSALESKLAPLMERLQPQQPPASQETKTEIDYNDLSGSINKLVQAALEARMGQTIPQLKEELVGNLKSTSKLQEARNYLISQNDIGHDQAKQAEIQEIIVNDELLYGMVESKPLAVVQRAVEQWRKSKTNPNVPSKDMLGTVGGGMSQTRRGGEPSLQKIKELQDKVISSNLPNDEREKLNREIETLMSVLK